MMQRHASCPEHIDPRLLSRRNTALCAFRSLVQVCAHALDSCASMASFQMRANGVEAAGFAARCTLRFVVHDCATLASTLSSRSRFFSLECVPLAVVMEWLCVCRLERVWPAERELR